MLVYRLTADAQTDLIEIRRFTVNQWGVAQSQKYLFKLRQSIRLLAETPSLGKSRPDVGSSVLSFPHASHVIYYVVHEQQLIVFGVFEQIIPVENIPDAQAERDRTLMALLRHKAQTDSDATS